MLQVWKDVLGYEGIYQVSHIGNVRSLDRLAKPGKGNGFREGRILRPGTNSDGYLIVCLYRKGVQWTYRIHQLVAIAFLKHVPCGSKIVVDHKDNDRINNALDNLQLISHRENCSKDLKGGTSKYVGVSWAKNVNKWLAQIKINGGCNRLGLFTEEIEASNAYQAALAEHLKPNETEATPTSVMQRRYNNSL